MKLAPLPTLSPVRAAQANPGRGRAQRVSRSLDDEYRNGGAIREDREWGRDLVTEMAMLSCRPDVLANELRCMGITPDGDEVLDD